MRRRALIGSSLLGLGTCSIGSPALASTRSVIEIVTTDLPPYAMAQGPEPGFVLTLSAELFRMLGLQVVFRFLPWPEAEMRAQLRGGVAIAPIRRTAARNSLYTWALPLFDDPSAFGVIDGPVPDTRKEARGLGRIAAVAGSRHEADLRAAGFPDILPVQDGAAAAAALRSGQAAVWFSAVPELRVALPTIRIGRPIFESPVWLALNRSTDDIMLPALHDAYAALEADGSIDQMLRPLLGSPP